MAEIKFKSLHIRRSIGSEKLSGSMNVETDKVKNIEVHLSHETSELMIDLIAEDLETAVADTMESLRFDIAERKGEEPEIS